MEMKLTFTGPSLADIRGQMAALLSETTTAPVQHVELVAPPAPKKTRAKKETTAVETAPQETPIGEVLADTDELTTPVETATEKLDLEKDIIPAVQAFVKKTEAKVGRDKALLQVKNILEKYSAKSIRDVSSDKYPELIKWFA